MVINSEVEEDPCPYCHKTYKNVAIHVSHAHSMRHQREKRNEMLQEGGKQCNKCDRVFKNQKALSLHHNHSHQ